MVCQQRGIAYVGECIRGLLCRWIGTRKVTPDEEFAELRRLPAPAVIRRIDIRHTLGGLGDGEEGCGEPGEVEPRLVAGEVGSEERASHAVIFFALPQISG
jgi:hypothetical protein